MSYINISKRIRKIFGIVCALLILAFPYFVMLQNDNSHIEKAKSLCPIKMLTGFPCPGCGMTKSLIFLYQGNFFKSFYYHLFGPAIFLFCIIVIVVLSAELVTNKEYFRNILYNKAIVYPLGFTFLIYYLARLIYFISTNNIDEILKQSIWK